MHHANTLYVGLDVHKDSIAVAYVPRDPDTKSSILAPLALGNATLINSCASCKPKPNTWFSSGAGTGPQGTTESIHNTPKRSATMPKREAKKVLVNGICTCPPSARAANSRSASGS
jgi:hypothetical protein